MLLAIDTSTGTSVAVVDRDAGILAEFTESDTRRHAELVGPMIAAALAEAGVAASELSGVVAGMGPGPFTGLRVGIAAAKAFAFGAGTPLIPVVSHDAIAFGADAPLLVVTDARRREVYWSAYAGSDDVGLPIRVAGPGLAAPDQIPVIERVELPPMSGGPSTGSVTGVVSAGNLGMVAELMYANRRPFAPDEALYLRSPDVTLSAGPKRVS